MASIVVEFRAVFIDPENEKSVVLAYQTFDDVTSTPNDITTARDVWATLVAAASQDQLQEATATIRHFTSFTKPAQGLLANSEDKEFLVFRSTDGEAQGYKVSIPGPKSSQFAADLETVDITAVATAALITHVVTDMCTKDGSLNLAYISGYRIRKKSRRERPGISSAIG